MENGKLIGLAIFVIALVLGMAVMVSVAVHGENSTVAPGKVVVFVYDEHGNAVQNATVQAITNTSQIVKSAITDKNGMVILDMSTSANFTGIIKVTADGYKDAQENITFNNTQGYAYTFHLIKDSNNYIDKAKNFYDEHKTAVIAGGAVIFLLIILMVMGGSKKIKW